MGSIRYTKITALEDVQKDIEFCRGCGILSSKHFKDWVVELNDKTIADYLGYCRDLLFSMYRNKFYYNGIFEQVGF